MLVSTPSNMADAGNPQGGDGKRQEHRDVLELHVAPAAPQLISKHKGSSSPFTAVAWQRFATVMWFIILLIAPAESRVWKRVAFCNEASGMRVEYTMPEIVQMAADATRVRICTSGSTTACVTSKPGSFPVTNLRAGVLSFARPHNVGWHNCYSNCVAQTWTGHVNRLKLLEYSCLPSTSMVYHTCGLNDKLAFGPARGYECSWNNADPIRSLELAIDVSTLAPTSAPTTIPTAAPTFTPTTVPTAVPTYTPTAVPTAVPTFTPTEVPTAGPTFSVPTAQPTLSPTMMPTPSPSFSPTGESEQVSQPSTGNQVGLIVAISISAILFCIIVAIVMVRVFRTHHKTPPMIENCIYQGRGHIIDGARPRQIYIPSDPSL
eukprot:m.20592 g.20592  ORF g.20592 m.20592 type:complete len:376 (-) comp12997_c0_seq2:306-1433(-)